MLLMVALLLPRYRRTDDQVRQLLIKPEKRSLESRQFRREAASLYLAAVIPQDVDVFPRQIRHRNCSTSRWFRFAGCIL